MTPALYLSSKALAVLASGGPSRSKLVAVLRAWLEEGGELATSGYSIGNFVAQCVSDRNSLTGLRDFLRDLDGLCSEVLEPSGADLMRALDLVDAHSISYGEAVELALALDRESTRVVLGPDLPGQSGLPLHHFDVDD